MIKKKPKNKINFLKKEFKNLNYRKLDYLNLHSPEISQKSAVIAKIGTISQFKKISNNFSKKNKNCCIEGYSYKDIAKI